MVGTAMNLSIQVPGTADVTNDHESFDCTDLSVIGDLVWIDADADGVRDMGEAGIPGVTVRLVDLDAAGTPVIATAVTDANGNYYFPVPNGNYRVVVDSATLPAGALQTFDDDGIGTRGPVGRDDCAGSSKIGDQDFGYAFPVGRYRKVHQRSRR